MSRSAAALGLALALGCGPAAVGTPLPAALPSRAPAAADLPAGPFVEVGSERFGLAFALPDGRAWEIDDRKDRWLTARHAPSASTLLVRTWHEDENANRERCEARARSWRDLPRRENADLFTRRRLDVPRGYDTRLDLAVVPARAGAPVAGFAIAFGGWAKRCFAFVYTTSAAGPEAERLLADRLEAITETLESVTRRSGLTPTFKRR